MNAVSGDRRGSGAVALWAACALTLGFAFHPGFALDFLPAYTAAGLVLEGRWDAVYLAPGSPHLFASHADFVRDAVAATGGAIGPDRVTAFVSPPPALLPLLPLAALPYDAAKVLWRLALAGVVVASLLDLARRRGVPGGTREGLWALGLLVSLPLVFYAMLLGQSALLLLAAAALFDPARARQRWSFCVVLAAAAMFKVFPVVIAGFLWLMGRRSDALRAMGVLAVWTAIGLVALPGELHRAFAEGLRAVSGGVLTGWNNFSFEASLLRFERGVATSWLRTPPAAVQLASWAARCLLCAAAVAIAVRTRGEDLRRWGAAWAATLSLPPVLWAHYLVVLPALLPDRTRGEAVVRLALLAGCGAWLLVRATGVFSDLAMGHAGGALWLASAAVLVWEASAAGRAP